MHYVYLLQSQSHPERRYVGLTSDLKARIMRHNEVRVTHTSKFVPWTLRAYVAFSKPNHFANFHFLDLA